MMKLTLAVFALTAASAPLSAQGQYTKATNAAKHARAEENAHVAAEQNTNAAGNSTPKAASAPAAKTQDPKSPAGSKAAAANPAPGKPAPAAKAPEVVPAVIMRESFDYGADGRRDPFVSLLTTNELRPTMSDLRLTGILFDHTGQHSVATLRDLTNNAQYRVTTGSTLGRMRVSAIKTTTVVFTIDEFGTSRRDSLTLRDTTKARP
jgi:hypothetical protein